MKVVFAGVLNGSQMTANSRMKLVLNLMALALSALFVLPASAQRIDEELILSLDSLLSIPVNAAVRYDQSSSDAPASITVVTRGEILRMGYLTLGEVLSGLGGFYSSYDRNYLYVGARGLVVPGGYNNRFLLLIDGQPLNDAFYGSAPLGTDLGLPLDGFDRVEVVRGPGGALYGNNAMFAVVNLITRAGKDVDGTQITGEVGTRGHIRGALTMGKEWSNGLDLFLQASGYQTEGENIHFPEFASEGESGVARELDWDWNTALRSTLRFRGASLNFLASTRKKAVPTAPWETLFNAETTTQDTWITVDGVWSRTLAPNHLFTARAYTSYYSSPGRYAYELPGGDALEETIARWAGFELSHNWETSARNRLSSGVEFRRAWEASYAAWDNDGVYWEGDFPFSFLAAYVQDEAHLTANTLLTLGLRADKFEGYEMELSPRAALVTHLGAASTLKVLYGSAFRAPDRYEAYYSDEASHRLNPDLGSEHLSTFEALWEQRITDYVMSKVSLFQTRISHLIDTGFDDEVQLSFFENVGKVISRGFEFEVTARHPSGYAGRLSYGYSRATYEPSGDPVTNSPHQLVRAQLQSAPILRITPVVEFRYDGSRYTVQETETEGNLLVDLTLSTGRFMNRAKASLAIKNLFDTEYYHPAGWEHTQYQIIQPGRVLRLRLDVSF